MTEIKPAYLGEAMLVRWSENHNGQTVTLQLDESLNEIHPFKGLKGGLNGQRMQLVAVLIDENEQPMHPVVLESGPDRAVSSQGSHGGGGDTLPTTDGPKGQARPIYTRSQRAALKVKTPEFVEWLAENYDHGLEPKAFLDEEDFGNALLKEVLGITSKRELDTMPNKASEWDKIEASFTYRNQER
jgi:hypothetical protein